MRFQSCSIFGATFFALIGVAPAHAVDGEYVTYGGFDATVSAFQYIALFFGNGEYGGLVFTIATLGFALGAFNSFISSGRDASRIVMWAFSFFFGASLFVAFVIPKGNVNVYDPVLNATATVAGVPDGIVIVANLASNLQQTAVTIADTASPRLYEDTANGSLFDIIRKTWTANNPIADEFIWESVKSYYIDCVSLATRLPFTGLTVDELQNTSTDLVASFAKAQSDSNFTTVYSSAAPGGNPMTCTLAWAAISPQVANVGTYTAFEDAVCANAGFDPLDANQRTRCTTLLDEAPTLFKQAGDRYSYLRGAALAQAMQEAMADVNPDRAIAAETNRRFIEQASGFFVTAQELGPFIRAAFLAAALSTLPLLFLFIVTPFMGSVLRLFIGFFTFVTLWSIIDVGIAQVARGIAVDAFEEVARHQIAYTAFMLTPTASVKALAVFGASRFIAIAFAALFVVTVFKISGASFAAITGPIIGAATSAGDGAAAAVVNPIGRASTTGALANATGVGRAMATDTDGSFEGWTLSHEGRLRGMSGEAAGARSAANGARFDAIRYAEGVTQGATAAGAAVGAASAGGASFPALAGGEAEAVRATAAASGMRSDIQTRSSVFTASNLKEIAADVAGDQGVDANDILYRMGSLDNIQRAAQLEAVDFDLNRAASVAGIRESANVGSQEGLAAGASTNDYSVEGLSRSRSELDATFGAGEADYFQRYGPNSEEMRLTRTAGEIRRERQAGGALGTEQGAAYLDQPASVAAFETEKVAAQRAVISAGQIQEFAASNDIPLDDILAAQGTNLRLASSPAVLNGLSDRLDQDVSTAAHAHNGVISLDFNPEDMSIVSQRFSSESAAMRDESTSFRGGDSLHDAPSLSGDTLFNYAMNDGGRGVSAFANLASRYESNGGLDNFEDIVARQGAQYLGGIAGLDMSFSESASNDARVDAFARGSGSVGGNVGFAKAQFETGAGVAAGSTDSNQTMRSETVSGYNAEIHDAFDRTIRNDQIGDMHGRTEVFFGELREMQGGALERNALISEKGEEPDGILGTAADVLSRRGDNQGEEISSEDFQELVRRSRFKQPGEM